MNLKRVSAAVVAICGLAAVPVHAGVVISGVYTCVKSEASCRDENKDFDAKTCTCVTRTEQCTVTLGGNLGGSGLPAYATVTDEKGNAIGQLKWGTYAVDRFGRKYKLASGSQYTWGSYDIATAIKPVSQGGLGCVVSDPWNNKTPGFHKKKPK